MLSNKDQYKNSIIKEAIHISLYRCNMIKEDGLDFNRS
jgi:hypothetical protein